MDENCFIRKILSESIQAIVLTLAGVFGGSLEVVALIGHEERIEEQEAFLCSRSQ
jgi:hypothetical protein